MTATLEPPATKGPKPVIDGQRPMSVHITVYVGVLLPLLALIAAVPFAWGWGLSWTDVALSVAFYYLSGLGITVAFHRYFTHGSFKAKPWLRVLLAVAGSTALQGPVIT